MTRVIDIINFLTNDPELHVEWLGTSADEQVSVTRPNKDHDAKDTEVAWISPKHISQEKIESFKGALLISPRVDHPPQRPLALCDKPKLAFIKIIQQFFSHLAEIHWQHTYQARDGESIIVSPGAVIGSTAQIASDVVIGPNTVVANCIIESGVRIGANCSIGLPGFGYEKDENGKYWRFPHIGQVILGKNVEIGSNTCIDRGSIGDTVLHDGVKVDNLVHIAHNVIIGENSLIIANSMIGGSVELEENNWVAPSVSIMNQVVIGKESVLGLGAVVLKDVESNSVMAGNPAKLLRKK